MAKEAEAGESCVRGASSVVDLDAATALRYLANIADLLFQAADSAESVGGGEVVMDLTFARNIANAICAVSFSLICDRMQQSNMLGHA